MAKKVSLMAVNSELRLANNGITIRIVDDQRERNGRLRIGRAIIEWKPTPGPGRPSRPFKKTWDQIIDFMKS